MRVAILTSVRHGPASQCLPVLAEHDGIEVAAVVWAEAHYVNRKRKLRRDLKKALRIGPLGVLTGLALRPWYLGAAMDDVFGCRRSVLGPLPHHPTYECTQDGGAAEGLRCRPGAVAGQLLHRAAGFPRAADGNAQRPRRDPAALPGCAERDLADLRGRGGDRLYGPPGRQGDRHRRDRVPGALPHRLPPDAARDRRGHVAEITRRVPAALAEVVADYPRYREAAKVQGGGGSYTTPTFWQFLRMRRQHRRLYRESARNRPVS